MARHSSFKIIIAHETYQRFFATIRAHELTDQRREQPGVEWIAGGPPANSGSPDSPCLPGQSPGEFAAADLPFFTVDGLPATQATSESWIESWLAGEIPGAVQ